MKLNAYAALALGLTTAAAAGATPALAHGASLRRGVYDCESYNIATGGLSYEGSLKLMSRHRYEGANGRHKARLIKPSRGRYSIRGKRVHFKRGSYRKAVGHITRSGSGGPPLIALYFKGKSSGISCYYVAKP